jgi:hypothetical protein
MSIARPSLRGFSKAIASNGVRGTALFSFEGMNLDALRFDHAGFSRMIRTWFARAFRVL